MLRSRAVQGFGGALLAVALAPAEPEAAATEETAAPVAAEVFANSGRCPGADVVGDGDGRAVVAGVARRGVEAAEDAEEDAGAAAGLAPDRDATARTRVTIRTTRSTTDPR